MIINFQIFEKVKIKNIHIGGIYRISGGRYGPSSRITSYKKLLPLVKIITMDGGPQGILGVKGYFEDTNEEYFFNIFQKDIVNIASPQEIDEFELIENSKKYNL